MTWVTRKGLIVSKGTMSENVPRRGALKGDCYLVKFQMTFHVTANQKQFFLVWAAAAAESHCVERRDSTLQRFSPQSKCFVCMILSHGEDRERSQIYKSTCHNVRILCAALFAINFRLSMIDSVYFSCIILHTFHYLRPAALLMAPYIVPVQRKWCMVHQTHTFSFFFSHPASNLCYWPYVE